MDYDRSFITVALGAKDKKYRQWVQTSWSLIACITSFSVWVSSSIYWLLSNSLVFSVIFNWTDMWQNGLIQLQCRNASACCIIAPGNKMKITEMIIGCSHPGNELNTVNILLENVAKSCRLAITIYCEAENNSLHIRCILLTGIWWYVSAITLG